MTFVAPSCFHSLLVAVLSDFVIIAVASEASVLVRYRLCFFASHNRVASTVTLTVLAESYELVARSVQVVLVARS